MARQMTSGTNGLLWPEVLQQRGTVFDTGVTFLLVNRMHSGTARRTCVILKLILSTWRLSVANIHTALIWIWRLLAAIVDRFHTVTPSTGAPRRPVMATRWTASQRNACALKLLGDLIGNLIVARHLLHLGPDHTRQVVHAQQQERGQARSEPELAQGLPTGQALPLDLFR